MRKKRIISIAAAVLCSAAFAFSIYKICSILLDRQESNSEYNGIVSEAVQVEDTSAEEHAQNVMPDLKVDFDVLKDKNPDTIGWIYLPDTKINYPIVQAADNDFYLNTLFSGKKNPAGSIFADYRCNDNTNLILYGHNMKNGTMFAPLIKYSRNKDYYNEHPTMYCAFPEGNRAVELFAGVKIKDTEVDFYPLAFSGENEFNAFVTKVKKRSNFKSEVTPEYGDRLAILSTCSYETDNSRYLVIGIIK